MTGTWGGKQSGAGRKPGAAWADKRQKTIRKASKASRIDILTERDPLRELVRLGFEAAEEGDRIKALAAAVPYLHPRLSMSVVADATPQQAERITREMLAHEIAERIGKLPTIKHDPVPLETDTD